MSSWNFVLSWVQHEKSFIISGPGKLACADSFFPQHFQVYYQSVIKFSSTWRSGSGKKLRPSLILIYEYAHKVRNKTNLNLLVPLSKGKVWKKAKIRNRYNQVPHRPRTPYGKVTKHKKTSQTREPSGQPFPPKVITRLQGTYKKL